MAVGGCVGVNWVFPPILRSELDGRSYTNPGINEAVASAYHTYVYSQYSYRHEGLSKYKDCVLFEKQKYHSSFPHQMMLRIYAKICFVVVVQSGMRLNINNIT